MTWIDLRSRPRLGGVAIAIAVFGFLLATEPKLAIVWDEGYTLGREARIRLWFQALRDPSGFAARWKPPTLELVQPDAIPPPRPDEINTRAKLFHPRALTWFWPFAREEPHGHPPFYAIVGMIGDLVPLPSLDRLQRARIGPMLAFSLAAGALFGFMMRRWGPWPALAATGAYLLQPRLFAHAHYATYDALLTSLWLGSVLAFAPAVERPACSVTGTGSGRLRPVPVPVTDRPRWLWVVVFGVLCGWAADTKLTGWFVPLPCLVWALLYRDRRAAWTLALGGFLALVVLFAFNPAFWPDPIGGVVRFFQSNLSRARTIPIETLFLGQVYRTPVDSLPWFNTLVWTVLVTPIGFLALSLVGLGRALKRFRIEPFGVLVVGHWAFLLLLRSLPHTPGHDGERQILPAFGMLAVVAGLGAAALVEHWPRTGRYIIGASILEGALSIALMLPVPLSYYSPIVGGLPGAAAIGMEPTYYWDALDRNALKWLDEHTPRGRSLVFATFPTSLIELRESQRLQSAVTPLDPGDPMWYVVQNRPGALRPWEKRLIARIGPEHVIASKLGVPLVWAFPIAEFERERSTRP